ncbi:MAG TPA: site-2 protease family protein [Anaerolineae bacterium]|nr:site-2 protease family protein [Anaerolineae bacterium]
MVFYFYTEKSRQRDASTLKKGNKKMGWSLKLGKWFGIEVKLHVTFLLVLGFLAVTGFAATRDAGAVAGSVGFLLALFLCVLLHEFGHALAARRYGIQTKDITLLPIGGLARLERMPTDPQQELVVALAGPAVNVVIALALLPLMALSDAAFFERLFSTNLLLVAFNLIPAFPMDGGRVLRAGLALKMNYAKATRTAAAIGQGFAVLFGFIGLFTNPFLLFIAVFIWFGAASESQLVQATAQLSGVPVERAMTTRFEILSPLNSLRYMSQLMMTGTQREFPVVEGGRPIGLVTRSDLFDVLARRGPSSLVGHAMQRDFATVQAEDLLAQAVEKLQTGQARALLVLRDGQLVGLLTLKNVQEFMLIQAALDRNPRSDKIEMMRTT